MAENVWEWTASKNNDNELVVRGGSWIDYDPSVVQAAYRSWFAPSLRTYFLGFRCAQAQ
jgi:formylglycine-generating enzyme required for sulfatase activity